MKTRPSRTRLLILLLALTGAVAVACDEYFGEDPTGLLSAARLIGFQLDPDSVNITDTAQSATGHVTVDAPAGVDSARVTLVGPGGQDTVSCAVDTVAAEDGDVSELRCTVTLAPSDTAGDWAVDRVRVHPSQVEPLTLGTDDLETAGYPYILDVARDRTELRSLDMEPDTADVTTGPATVQAAVELFHVGPGIDSVRVALQPDGDLAPSCLSSAPTGGDRFDGLWSCDLTIPETASPGDWRLAAVTVFAGQRQPTSFGADSVAALGQEDGIHVVSGENQPPTASITAPTDGSSYIQGQAVTLEGSGIDPEDGTLTGASLEWSSDLDGALGTGETVTTSLSVGTHTITLTATDSGGASDTDQVTVSVTVAPTGWFVFVNEQTGTREFYRMAADGSGLTQLTTSVNNSRPMWSPDGSRIAFGDGGDRGVWVMDSDGSDIQQLTDYPSGSPTWSPDGTELAIQASDGSDWEVFVIDPVTGDTLRVLTDNADPDQYPTWSPDGAEIAVMGASGLTRISAADGTFIQSYGVDGWNPVWSPDGSEIAFSQPQVSGYQIVIVDVASGATRQLTTDSATHLFPAWSPDGTYIAYARAPEFSGQYDLYVTHADGTGASPRQLTTDPANDWYPDWTDTIAASTNTAPTATINSPSDGASFVRGDTIVFDGTGSDPEDGSLTGTSLEWTSDLDGTLGTGTTLSRSDLSVGTHVITLTATDSDGATGSASVTITVDGIADLGVSMTATPDPVLVDSTLSHAITIGNAGPDPVTNLQWTLLVEGDVLISSPNQEGCSDFTSSDPPSKLFQCSIDSLAVDEVLNFQLDVVPQQAGDTLVSTARLESWDGAVDPDPSNNTAVDSTTVEGVSGSPTATITAPADSSLYSQESTVTFEGSGSDPEDGALVDSALVWTSDIDGDIGVGTSLSVASLSVGTHTITLTATDSDGLTGTDSVVVGIAMAMGTNHQDSIAGQGDTDRFPFRADSGDVINVGYLNETLDGRVYVTVLDSTGAQLRQVRSPLPLYGNYVETDLIELTAAGWYFIEITGVDSGSVGVYRIGLSRVSPPTAIGLAVPYADASGVMSVIGQRQYFSFENSADAVMNFAALTPESDVWLYVYICSPGTTPYWDRSCFTNFRTTGGSNESGRQVLPEGGTYIVEVRTTGNAFANFQGGYDLRAFVPALTPVLMDQTYTDSITPAYDLDRFSVDHPTELPAFLVRTEHAYSGYIYTYVYSDPTSEIDWDRSSTPSYASESAHEVGPLLLGAGTYLIEQDASGPGTADYSFNVVTIEPPVTMTDSARVDGSIDQSGERDYFEITGTAGQQLEVEITSGTDHNGYVRVYPLPADGDYTTRDTSPLTSFGYDAVSIVADTITLPSDTSYIIEVDGGRYGIGASTGQYSLFTSFVPAESTTGDLYVAVESDNAMAVLDTATYSVQATITVPQWPWAVAVAPDGSEVYTASRDDGAFTVIDAAANAVDTTIATTLTDPFDMAISPDGATVYVLDNNQRRVAIFDVASRAVTGDLFGASSLPNAVALDPSGDTAFVVAGDTVVAFDIATETAIDTLTGAFALTADGAVTPDGTELVFTDFDNNRLVIVDRATFTVVDSVTGIAEPRGMAITSDGATAWVAARSASSLVPVDLASRTAGTAISLPFQPYWVAVTPDGATLYATEGRGGTQMAVIDVATASVTTTITLGDGPAQIGIRP